jgi:hypothetical protein
MARLSNPSLWDRDWFLDLEGRFQLFCLYIRDHCNCAGVWQPSFKRFEQATGFRINQSEYLAAANKDEKNRVIVLPSGKWWIVGFIEDQCNSGLTLSPSSNFHKGIINSLEANEVPYLSYGYKLRVSDPSRLVAKVLEKEEEKEEGSFNVLPLEEGMQGEKKKIRTWKTSFWFYLSCLIKASRELITKIKTDEKYRSKLQKAHPGIDLIASIEKAMSHYWGQKTGWNYAKKNRKGDDLNYILTLINAIDINKVWLPKESYGQGQPTGKNGLSQNSGRNSQARLGYSADGKALGAVARAGEFEEGVITLDGVTDHLKT